jgi:tetratricopeptide (TPR) repeat protein
VSPNAASLPPGLRGRYGWWFYGSGQYDSAVNWLQSAVEELPSDPILQTRLGWVLIEQRNLEAAIGRFESPANGYHSPEYGSPNQRRRLFHEKRMGLAVAEWQAQQFDRAMSGFASAAIAQPEWLNPQWVGALYSPGVAKTIEEMKVEQKKRRGSRAGRNGE